MLVKELQDLLEKFDGEAVVLIEVAKRGGGKRIHVSLETPIGMRPGKTRNGEVSLGLAIVETVGDQL